MRLLFIPLVAILALNVSCSGDDIQFAEPPKRTGSEVAPPPRGMPNPHADTGAQAGEEDPFADPQADAAAQKEGSRPPGGEPLYEGTVSLPEGVTLPRTYSVYVVAYQPGTSIPALVQKYQQPKFPFEFVLTLQNAQLGEPEKGASLQLGVIFSETGSVTPGGGGAFSKTVAKDATKPGAKAVKLTVKPW